MTVAAVIEQQGRFLLVQERISGASVFNQPAGHLEDNESLVDAVIRETQEETAWEFAPDAIVGIYQWRHPEKEKTFIRVSFSGRGIRHDPAGVLDEEIEAEIVKEQVEAGKHLDAEDYKHLGIKPADLRDGLIDEIINKVPPLLHTPLMSGANAISGITLVGTLVTSGVQLTTFTTILGFIAVAMATASLIAIGCQQYRVCNTGKCPMGIATQDPELCRRLDVEQAAGWLKNFLQVSTNELRNFARLTGNDDVHKLSIRDLCTTNSEISNHTAIEHV